MFVPCLPPRITSDDVGRTNWGHKLDFHLAFEIDPNTWMLVKRYHMRVFLWKGHSQVSGNPRVQDLQFGIMSRDERAGGKTHGPVFDYREPRRLLNRDARTTARMLLMDATACLADIAQPTYITMSTYDADLPAKALDKYCQIAAVLTERGYAIQETLQTPDGKLHWHLRRAS